MSFHHSILQRSGGTSVLAAVLLGLVPTVYGQQTAVGRQDVDDNSWFARVTPYFWLSNIGGSKSLGLSEVPNVGGNYVVEVGNEELYPDFAASIAIGKGRWALSGYFQSGSIGDTTEIAVSRSPVRTGPPRSPRG